MLSQECSHGVNSKSAVAQSSEHPKRKVQKGSHKSALHCQSSGGGEEFLHYFHPFGGVNVSIIALHSRQSSPT
jgi:hypothetical protein